MSLDIAGINMVNAIRSIATSPVKNDMIFGEVVSVKPLEIDIGGNVILKGKMLYLGQMCRPYKVTIPHKHLIDAHLTESSKGIKTTKTSHVVGTPQNVDVDQKINYETHTQDVKPDDDTGTDEHSLNTDTQSNVDVGGAQLRLSVNVTGSTTTMGVVTNTTDSSSLDITDNGHKHLIEQFETQDVHFPNTDYEESVTIEIYPRLHVGDIVVMFAMNNRQMFYVMERVERAE